MIYCRRCMTKNDDGADNCSVCGAELNGADGVRIEEPPVLDELGDIPGYAPPTATPGAGSSPETDDHQGAAALAARPGPDPPPPPPAGDAEPDAPRPARRGVVPATNDATTDRVPFIVLPDRNDVRIAGDAKAANAAGEADGTSSTAAHADGGGPQDRAGHRAVRPDEVAPEAGPDDANVGVATEGGDETEEVREWPRRSPVDGEVACSRCREPNPETRRFCLECGTTLPAFDGWTPPPPDPVPPPDNWWRKLTRTTAHGDVDRRTQRQIEKDLGQAGSAYSAGRTLETRLAVVAAVAVGLAALVAAAVVLSDVLTMPADAEPALGITPVDPSLAYERHPPTAALDGNPETGFAIGIEPVGEAAAGIQEISNGSRFTVELPPGTLVEEVQVDVGFPNDAAELDPGLYARAQRIRIYNFGDPLDYDLDDRAGPQRLEIPAGRRQQVTGFGIEVLAVHDRDWEIYDLALFVEIGVVKGQP